MHTDKKIVYRVRYNCHIYRHIVIIMKKCYVVEGFAYFMPFQTEKCEP